MTIYDCGCQNEIDPDSGVLHCVKKCQGHIDELANQKQDCIEYYESLGCLKNGVPQNRKYIAELEYAIAQLDAEKIFRNLPPLANVLEIGCGLGMYVPYFLLHGWDYGALETSEFAANWVENTFDVIVDIDNFANLPDDLPYTMLFGAHVFEHMKDAPAALARTFDMIEDKGHLFLIVPDDTDPINPDHWWFFNVQTLHALLEKIGFKNIRSTTRKLIERENFIYCIAEK